MEKEKVEQEGTFKVKRKPGRPKKLQTKNEVSKVDLTKKEKDAVQESKPKEPVLQSNEQEQPKQEEVKVELQEVGSTHGESEKPTEETKEEVVVINETPKEEKQVETKKFDEPQTKPQITLPENVEKLVKFMKETGGTVEDYVTLNKDYTSYNDDLLVREYYKKTRPHLSDDEVSFLMEDNFKYDEEVDEERFVRKQKLKYKEEIAKARTFLDTMKSKYYDEIKLRPSITNEQQKAMDFFNRYNKEQSTLQEKRNMFINNTKNYFQDKFEGFDFEVGDKKFRYKVSNTYDIADNQTDINKFTNQFMDNEGNIVDYAGYHKALYAARNADRIAHHFYEQGKADATRDIVQNSKNINQTPRSGEQGEVMPNGWRVRAITGADSTKLKIKKRTT